MFRRKIVFGLVFILLFSSTFLLSGCSKKDASIKEENVQKSEQTQDKAEEKNADSSRKEGVVPTEMIDACVDKIEGDSCSVTMPPRSDNEESKSEEGACKKNKNLEIISCVPNNMPQKGNGAPPEAK